MHFSAFHYSSVIAWLQKQLLICGCNCSNLTWVIFNEAFNLASANVVVVVFVVKITKSAFQKKTAKQKAKAIKVNAAQH